MAPVIIVCLLLQATTAATEDSIVGIPKQVVRRRLDRFQNPCTGSWSNDVQPEVKCDNPVTGSDGDGNGTSTGNSTHLHCLLSGPDDSNASFKPTSFDYWYGVETPDNSTSGFLSILEGKIFSIGSARMSWCFDDGTGNRRLFTMETKATAEARRLGILGVNSAPDDVETKSKSRQLVSRERLFF